jgi:hypothetical protein
MTLNMNRVFLFLLFFGFATSKMVMRGSSSTIVPTPWPSAMVALVSSRSDRRRGYR